jgi:uncharacterized membrane protein
MENLPNTPGRLAGIQPILKVTLIIATGLVLLGWWLKTPPGLLGKADAAGYAVCHRIASRSFLIGDRQMPLCARCSGMYLGALLGIGYLAGFGKRAGMPSLKISIVLGVFLAAFALDGGNSYLHFFPNAPGLYQPENWLRLLTGTGVGLGIACVLVPVVHQTLWQGYDSRRALAGWRQFLPLLGLAGLLDLAILSDIPLLLYPLALLSSASIFLILAMVYCVVWVMLTKRENHYLRYRDLWVPVLAGFLTALVQIAAMDAGRFWLTGTWAGFKF